MTKTVNTKNELKEAQKLPAEREKDDESIDHALSQMETIYRSRCVQPQGLSNVTVREIKKEE